MCGSMVDIQSAIAEIRRGKKDEEERKKKIPHLQNIMSASAAQGGHNNSIIAVVVVLPVLILTDCGVVGEREQRRRPVAMSVQCVRSWSTLSQRRHLCCHHLRPISVAFCRLHGAYELQQLGHTYINTLNQLMHPHLPTTAV